MSKIKPTLNDRKQVLFFKIVELLNKRGGRLGKSNFYRLEWENNYIQIDNNTMNLIYGNYGNVDYQPHKYNINDLENCDIAVLKHWLMDVINAMRNN